MAQFDFLIRNGVVIDGSGGAGWRADVAVAGGRIVEVAETVDGTARETINADGCIVTPGFVDIHTHFDGQATWDDRLEPAFGHGVTTVVMGNCGVGFAPVRPGGQDDLIDIMEGVEDIPGTALHEAMPWGAWESYPQYLDYLRGRRYALDVGSHMAHGALRAYVMGPEDIYRKQADADQIAQMARMVREGMRAGALGLSTNRIMAHRGLSGEQVPGTFASESELSALAEAMGQTGAGVMQLVPGQSTGTHPAAGPDLRTSAEEVAMMGRLSRLSGRPVTFTLVQVFEAPQLWRQTLADADREAALGAQLYPQFAARPSGIICGLTSYHIFQRRETFLKLRSLPLDRLVAELRKPEVKEAILADRDILDDRPGSMENFVPQLMKDICGAFYSMGAAVDYEPLPERSVGRLAQAGNRSEQSIIYDMMLEQDGRNFVLMPIFNYAEGSHEPIREMFTHPRAVAGLSDAGAHVKLICDASTPTYALTHWVRDRTRGDRLPLELVVNKLTARNADLYGLTDRGRVAPGQRADLNIIDLDALKLELPVVRHDLPTGAARILQPAKGYKATLVKGEITRVNDEDTGARPGRLVDGAAYVS